MRKIVLFFSLLFIGVISFCQTPAFQVQSPKRDCVTLGGNGYFVAMSVDAGKTFIAEETQAFMDQTPIKAEIKFNDNRLTFISRDTLANGIHRITIWTRLSKSAEPVHFSWFFYINEFVETDTTSTIFKTPKPTLSKQSGFKGNIETTSRNEFLSGAGQSYRQEPNYTGTVRGDFSANYGQHQLSAGFFLTTDNNGQFQKRNNFHVGFKNKYTDIAYGDLYPNLNRLILPGTRITGFKIIGKYGAQSIQIYKGTLKNAVEGSLATYVPGTGSIPAHLINDSTYLISGTYKRNMTAVRLEGGMNNELFKLAYTFLKATDEINSIQYGIAPKQNIALGFDGQFKVFKKRLRINSGIAASAITNDISFGVANKATIDSVFYTSLPFDPVKYQNTLILNSSTVPLLPDDVSFIAWYGEINFTNKRQSFDGEYRKTGPQFISLGNPFLANNLESLHLSERIFLWKKRLTFSATYAKSMNDLNNTLISKIRSDDYGASLFFLYSAKYPTASISYNYMEKNSTNGITQSSLFNTRLNIFTMFINYDAHLFKRIHGLRLIFNKSLTTDLLRNGLNTDFMNAIVGLKEKITSLINLSLEYGVTMMTGSEQGKISDLNNYGVMLDCKIKKLKGSASLSFTNSTSAFTTYTHQSNRLSINARISSKLNKNLTGSFEYGFQPYYDITDNANNYGEQFVFVKLGYSFAKK